MDEFKPEDELKPDASDRRPTRPRKSSSAPKLPVSRQHMMMGIGIFVLLLLVLGIGSALKGPDNTTTASSSAGNSATSSGNEKNIDLTGAASMSGQTGSASPDDTRAPGSENASSNAPRDITMPPVSPTPTQASPTETPENQQRVTLTGDLNSALSNQQGEVNNVAGQAQSNSTLPTAPATVSGNNTSNNAASANRPQTDTAPTRHAAKPAAPHKTQPALAAKESKPQSGSVARHNAPASSSAASKGLPAGSYTLQLSSASRSDTLNAWAKKQNLSAYHVYKTTRNGQPWYVLISGSYATSAEAKRAVAALPAEVRAQKPWVKPLSQVKKEASN